MCPNKSWQGYPVSGIRVTDTGTWLKGSEVLLLFHKFSLDGVGWHMHKLPHLRQVPIRCCIAVGPFAQARDAAQQEGEEEHLIRTWEKWLWREGKRGYVVAPKWIFMRLRHDSYLARMNVYLSWSSKKIHMTSDVFGLSNTKYIRRNAVLH